MPTTVLQPDTTKSDHKTIGGFAPSHTSTEFWVGEGNDDAYVDRALIKFLELSDGTIPADALVTSAVLELTAGGTSGCDFSNNARTMRAYRILRNWVDSQADWNNYSTGNAWATAGATGTGDIDPTDIGNVSVAANNSIGDKISITS